MTHVICVRLAGLLAATLLFSGCRAMDPYQRAGMWRPEGVVNANLAAQLANPADLVRGHGDTGPVYRQTATAVTKLWSGSTAAAVAAPAAGGAAPAAGGGDPGVAPK
jgi:hypothetical protein